ncbi:MAG: DUF4276 family protein [Pseudomonadota bacterium]
MTILIAGEGPEDIGFSINGSEYDGDIKLVLFALLRAHGWKGGNFGSDNIMIRDAPKVHRQTAANNAEIKKIINLIAHAHWNNFQMCVVVIDVRKKHFKKISQQLSTAEKELAAHGIEKFIIGLAVHEIEAWILADTKARKAVLDKHAGHYKFSGKPEDDPDPKSSLKQLTGQWLSANPRFYYSYRTSEPENEIRQAMIGNIKPEVAAKLCPLGFKPFYEKVKKAFIPLFVKGTPER